MRGALPLALPAKGRSALGTRDLSQLHTHPINFPVIPAKAGIQEPPHISACPAWIPAFAGMTKGGFSGGVVSALILG